MLNFFIFISIGASIYILPGFLFLEIVKLDKDLTFWEKLGLSCSLSLSFYPLLFLWGYIVRLSSIPLYALLPLCLLSMLFLLKLILKRNFRRLSPRKEKLWKKLNFKDKAIGLSLIFFASLILLFFVRWLAIRGKVAPSWGDSVHHALIIKLILEKGGLFQTWEPYAPLASLTYHFGLHADAAVWAWLAGQSAHRALLWAGQFVNGLAVLALLPLCIRWCGRRSSIWWAVLIAGFVFPFPGYLVNYGRYTQLAGMVILPGIIFLTDKLLEEEKQIKETRGQVLTLSLLISGLGLTHYRVLALSGVAIATCLIIHFIAQKNYFFWWKRGKQILFALCLSILFILPWAFLLQKRIKIHSDVMDQTSWAKPLSDFWIWKQIGTYFPHFFWIIGAAILGLALIFRKKLAVFIFLWIGLSFTLMNFLLPDTNLRNNLFSNDTLLFCLYLPLSLLFGWLGEAIWGLTKRRKLLFQFILGCLYTILLIFGVFFQAKIINPFFEMVTVNDIEAFRWIRQNTSINSKFLINGAIIYDGRSIAGSDGGWWLSYFTGRQTSIPPFVYNVESLSPGIDRNYFFLLGQKIKEVRSEASLLRDVLEQAHIEYIFLGEKRGRVSFEPGELIPEQCLRGKNEFQLVFQKGKAQVWKVKPKLK